MSKYFEIIVGIMLGVVEYVVDVIVEKFDVSGYIYIIYVELNLDEIKIELMWIVCILIYGVGELFDNIQLFVKQLEGVDLSVVNVYVIGLGDISYDIFCFGVKEMEKYIKNVGGMLIIDVLYIDVLEYFIFEDVVVEWFDEKFVNV